MDLDVWSNWKLALLYQIPSGTEANYRFIVCPLHIVSWLLQAKITNVMKAPTKT